MNEDDDDPIVAVTNPSPDRILRAIAEEDSKEVDGEGTEASEDKEEVPVHHRQGDEVHEVANSKQGLTEDDLQLLSKWWWGCGA